LVVYDRILERSVEMWGINDISQYDILYERSVEMWGINDISHTIFYMKSWQVYDRILNRSVE